MPQIEGVFSVLPTPFNPDGAIDHRRLARVIDLFLRAGVDGFTTLGVTSEVARVNERVSVVVGTTAGGITTCIDYSKMACSAGASAVMVSLPRMPKLNSESIVRHFRLLAEAVDFPIDSATHKALDSLLEWIRKKENPPWISG
jgi:4-hydroxy-tetrahydrodipicolinate synthase